MVYSHTKGCGPFGTADYVDCDGVWSNGCETVADVDGNCGVCGRVCDAGQLCTNGSNYSPVNLPACIDPTSHNPTSSPQCGGAWFCGVANGC
jgi:hypothetical protein